MRHLHIKYSLTLFIAILLSGCSGPYRLEITNEYGKDIMIEFNPTGDIIEEGYGGHGDTLKYLLKKDTTAIIRTPSYTFVYAGWDYELKPVFIYDNDRNIIEILRIATSFISKQDFKFSLPFNYSELSTNFSAKLTEKDLKHHTKSEKKEAWIYSTYNLTQLHYNTHNFDSTLYYADYFLFENTDILSYSEDLKIKNETRKDIEEATKRGIAILGLFSAIKLEKQKLTIKFTKYLEDYHNTYWEYFKMTDKEIVEYNNWL